MKKKEKPKTTKRVKTDFNLHMKGMPEFNQPNVKPVKQLTVNFMTNEDMHKFSKLVGQQITAKTRSIYYPEMKEENAIDKRWSK